MQKRIQQLVRLSKHRHSDSLPTRDWDGALVVVDHGVWEQSAHSDYRTIYGNLIAKIANFSPLHLKVKSKACSQAHMLI